MALDVFQDKLPLPFFGGTWNLIMKLGLRFLDRRYCSGLVLIRGCLF